MAKIHLNSNHWAAILLLLLVIPGLLLSRRPKEHYALTAQEILQEILAMHQTVTPDQVREHVKQGDTDWILIDVRTPEEYIVKHIKGAVNVPMHELLGEKMLELLKDTTRTFVIYADDEVKGCGPWMLLRQMGYSNVRVMLGGFEYYLTGKPFPSVEAGQCYDEQPRYDYAKYFKGGGGQTSPAKKKTPKEVVPKRKKRVVASGGC